LWALVSCSNVVQPAPTETVTSKEVSTVTPEETEQVLATPVSTLEVQDSPMPSSGDVLNPQGKPVQDWRGIPIMTEAIAGQEFTVSNAYSFRVDATTPDVQAFYDERLTLLGWSQPFTSSLDENGGTMTFRKEGRSLAITLTPSGDFTIVLLVLTVA
jgi:hypothetical protein